MRTMAKPLIGLLTDFGVRDSYVAQVKLVIAGRVDCDLVDLSHEIGPQDVMGAGIFLREIRSVLARAEIQRPVIIVAIVDPGVGTDRKIVCVRDGRETVLAPDNGILPIAYREAPEEIREVNNERLFLRSGSRTFDGRDRFAPVAASLAAELGLEELGPPLEWSRLARVGWQDPVYEAELARGSIVSTDHFGNLITDIEADRVAHLAPYEVTVGDRTIKMIHANYSDAGRSTEPFLIIGSRNTLEISVNRGSAAQLLQPDPFDEVTVRSTKRES